MKADLHVHSKYSKRPSQWVLQKIGCPESFTEPLRVYQLAHQKGMNAVTITDHNTIEGALEIAHLPGTFISEEITTYFPEDKCKIHVLAYDINESIHAEIQKIRDNIFELAVYLREKGILHAVAHPLYAVNDRLTVDHFEKLLLLFQIFEENGARSNELNHGLQDVLTRLTAADIAQLADKHGLEPAFSNPHVKFLIGGSDDHSGLNIARSYTEVPGVDHPTDFLHGVGTGRGNSRGNPSTPQTLAHNLYGIAYQFYKNRFQLDRHVNKDLLLKFLDRSLSSDAALGEHGSFFTKILVYFNHRKQAKAETEIPDNLVEIIRHETQKYIGEHPEFVEIPKPDAPIENRGKNWFQFVNQVSNKVMHSFADHIMDHLSGANVFNIFHTIGSAGGLYALLAPYFVSYSQFTKDRLVNEAVLERFRVTNRRESDDWINVAHFTDTFYEVNGVAYTLQQQLEVAIKTGKKLTVITCDPGEHPHTPGTMNFKPVGLSELPEYPEQKIFHPPFLEMLDYCYAKGFTHIHSATPGPIGLAALGIANILKLPICGTYHTQLPQYAQYLTGDQAIEDLTWRYTLWYYNQMDYVYVPSKSTGDELIQRGIRPEKVRRFPRGINIDRFHPSNRNGVLTEKYGIREKTKLLYVGRVSKEKNLPLLVDCFTTLLAEFPDIHLVVVGDGPYLAEMKKTTADLPCTFTGYLKGEELTAVFASADIFVFPSTTDTFGNVILEAQASGLPVVVTDMGGPQENIIAGETGWIVNGNNPADLTRGIRRFLEAPAKIRTMGDAARKYMEKRSFEEAYIRTWEMLREDSLEEGDIARAS